MRRGGARRRGARVRGATSAAGVSGRVGRQSHSRAAPSRPLFCSMADAGGLVPEGTYLDAVRVDTTKVPANGKRALLTVRRKAVACAASASSSARGRRVLAAPRWRRASSESRALAIAKALRVSTLSSAFAPCRPIRGRVRIHRHQRCLPHPFLSAQGITGQDGSYLAEFLLAKVRVVRGGVASSPVARVRLDAACFHGACSSARRVTRCTASSAGRRRSTRVASSTCTTTATTRTFVRGHRRSYRPLRRPLFAPLLLCPRFQLLLPLPLARSPAPSLVGVGPNRLHTQACSCTTAT